MSCPTCDHTMQSIGLDETTGIVRHWCPRCGTMKSARNGHEYIESPKLVERCRHFEIGLFDKDVNVDCLIDNWREDSISESINPPERRPS